MGVVVGLKGRFLCIRETLLGVYCYTMFTFLTVHSTLLIDIVYLLSNLYTDIKLNPDRRPSVPNVQEVTVIPGVV